MESFQHNSQIFFQSQDFWLIWTEITPILLFSCMVARLSCYMHDYDILFMYSGAIICRTCSLMYHIIKTDILLYIDMIGISANVWAVPYLHRMTFQNHKSCMFIPVMTIYIYLNVSCIYSILNKVKLPPSQFPIVLLTIIGSYPIIYNCVFLETNKVQILMASGSGILSFGYFAFFVAKLPESIIIGIRNSSWYYSHSLWHISSALGQLCFLLIPFIFI